MEGTSEKMLQGYGIGPLRIEPVQVFGGCRTEGEFVSDVLDHLSVEVGYLGQEAVHNAA